MAAGAHAGKCDDAHPGVGQACEQAALQRHGGAHHHRFEQLQRHPPLPLVLDIDGERAAFELQPRCTAIHMQRCHGVSVCGVKRGALGGCPTYRAAAWVQ